jgi:hypothetical protein
MYTEEQFAPGRSGQFAHTPGKSSVPGQLGQVAPGQSGATGRSAQVASGQSGVPGQSGQVAPGQPGQFAHTPGQCSVSGQPGQVEPGQSGHVPRACARTSRTSCARTSWSSRRFCIGSYSRTPYWFAHRGSTFRSRTKTCYEESAPHIHKASCLGGGCAVLKHEFTVYCGEHAKHKSTCAGHGSKITS